MPTKDELKGEISRLVRSRGWYRGQFERLSEETAIQAEQISILKARQRANAKQIKDAKLVVSSEEIRREKVRAERENELQSQRDEARNRVESGEPEDEDEARLFRCQRENARLRKIIDKLEDKIKTE